MKIFFEKDKDIRRGNGVMVMIFFFLERCIMKYLGLEFHEFVI